MEEVFYKKGLFKYQYNNEGNEISSITSSNLVFIRLSSNTIRLRFKVNSIFKSFKLKMITKNCFAGKLNNETDLIIVIIIKEKLILKFYKDKWQYRNLILSYFHTYN